MRKVLLTGAAGGVGRMIRPMLRQIYPELVLSDMNEPEALQPNEPFRRADLSNIEEVEAAVAGMEGILHLGGFSVEGPWETILQANIVGCYNLYEAARRAGVKRIVFASSNHAMGFYPRRSKIGIAAIPRPDTRYGISKVFGEAVGAMFADKHGIGVLSIRIGNVGEKPIDKRRLAIWLHPEDLVQLMRIGLEHPGLRYEVVYGMSSNERAWWDNTRAYELGYQPRHRAEDHVDFALAGQARLKPDAIADFYQGGDFCALEHSAPK